MPRGDVRLIDGNLLRSVGPSTIRIAHADVPSLRQGGYAGDWTLPFLRYATQRALLHRDEGATERRALRRTHGVWSW